MNEKPLKIETMATLAKFLKKKLTAFDEKNLVLIGPGNNPTFGNFDIMHPKKTKNVI